MQAQAAPTLKSQIKTKERIRDFGEVFTNEREVNAMLDLLPKHILQDISATYLEPAAGDGNFLVAILQRKLDLIPASHSPSHTQRQILQALCAIYGVELLGDNLRAARKRVFQAACSFHTKRLGTPSLSFLRKALSIIRANLLQGDFLSDDLRFCFYTLGESCIDISIKPISTLLDPNSLVQDSTSLALRYDELHTLPRTLSTLTRKNKRAKQAKKPIIKPPKAPRPKAPEARSLFGDSL